MRRSAAWLGLVVCLVFACDGSLSGSGSGDEGGEGVGAPGGPPPRLRVTGTGDGLRLREGPGDGDTIVRIPDGCLIDAIGPPQLGWLPVRWYDLEGWVYGGFLEHAEPEAADCSQMP